MALHIRALELAGVITDGKLSKTEPPKRENFAFQQFVEGLYDRSFKDVYERANEEDEPSFRAIINELFKATVRFHSIIGCTLNMLADGMLRECCHPELIIIDEGAQANELETLMAFVHNHETVKQIVIIGDHKQLPPTVISRLLKFSGKVVNVFGDQLFMSWFERLAYCNFPVFPLNEQHRMVSSGTESLSDASSMLSYGMTIKNAPSTQISLRPEAQRALQFLEAEYDLKANLPHIFLNVSSGVTMRFSTMSRSNLHNIVAIMNYIERAVAAGVWKAEDFVIIVPYRDQFHKVRGTLARMSRDPFWQDKSIEKILVTTLDSFQGGEGKCVCLDLVLARARKGTPGFIAERPRINVGVSRAIYNFVIFGDVEALSNRKADLADESATIIEDDGEHQVTKQWETGLQKLFNFYQAKAVVVDVDPGTMAQKKYVDPKLAEDFRAELASGRAARMTCNRCGESGHVVRECDKPDPNIICNRCGEIGRKSKGCDQPRVEMRTCKICNTVGHIGNDCPDNPFNYCRKCGSLGHKANECDQPETRTCTLCGKQGHLLPNCNRKALNLPIPYKAQSKAQRGASAANVPGDPSGYNPEEQFGGDQFGEDVEGKKKPTKEQLADMLKQVKIRAEEHKAYLSAQSPPEQPAPEQPAPKQPAPQQPAPKQPAPKQPGPNSWLKDTEDAINQIAAFQAANDIQICAQCGELWSSLSEPFVKCHNCDVVYCTNAHLKEHWDEHKKVCAGLGNSESCDNGNSDDSSAGSGENDWDDAVTVAVQGADVTW